MQTAVAQDSMERRAGEEERTAPPARVQNAPPSRDGAIDVLRGWAIVLMSLSHIGGRTPWCTLAHLPLWVSAADPFVLLSGLVMGMRARRAPRPPIARRAFQFWQIHCVLMFLVLFVHEQTGRLRAPSLDSVGGWLGAAWMVPTLRLQAEDFMNILPLFIVFFAITNALLWALDRGQTAACLAVSAALWMVAQRYPEWLRFTDPRSGGGGVFVLFAWQFAYVLALVVGYHSMRLSAIWSRNPWMRYALVVLVGALFIAAQLQRNVLARLGLRFPPEWEWLTSKNSWGPLRVLYDPGLLLLGYLGLKRLERVEAGRAVFSRVLAPLELLGRKSLYCFLVHLPLALLASGLAFETWPLHFQDVAALLAIVIVYQMAKHDVLRAYIPG